MTKFTVVDHILHDYSNHSDIERVAAALIPIQDIKGVEQLVRTGLDRGWVSEDVGQLDKTQC
jgi:hypothetical protein